MSGSILKILIVTFLLYCFVGIWSFIPYFLGILGQCFNRLIDLVSFNIYPVGNLVYIINSGLLLFLVIFYLVKPLFKSD